MRLKEGFTLRDICGLHVLVPEGLKMIDFKSLMNLNGSSKFLWESLQEQDFDAEKAARLLTDNYEVDYEPALADVKELFDQWKQIGLLDE